MQALFILDSKGKVLISRQYRGHVVPSIVTSFVSQLLEEDDVDVKVRLRRRSCVRARLGNLR